MLSWHSALSGAFWLLVKLYCAFMLFSLIVFAFSMVTMIGDHTLVNETIHLAPGEAKNYYLPPGMVFVNFHSDLPIGERGEGFTSSDYGNGITWSNNGYGTPFGVNETIINTGDQTATVDLRIHTGVLNPFGWALYG